MENNFDKSLGIKSELSEDEAVPRFAPEQMLECEACRRRNPPTRLNCFYCGARLEIADANTILARPASRKLESWEKGFNIALLGTTAKFNDAKTNEIAAFLRLEKADLTGILQAQVALPLVRVETIDEAELIKNRLETANLHCAVIADASLEIEKMPRRVRAIEFSENSFAARLSGGSEVFVSNRDDLKLFVVGTIVENKRESADKRKRGDTAESGEAREFSADEKVLDFYLANDWERWRISANSFDFSCLGERKRLLASENFAILLEHFRQFAPAAAIDENYRKSRQILNAVWAVEERRESTGWQREGLGKMSLGKLTTVSNANQFTRYSGLLREILRQNGE